MKFKARFLRAKKNLLQLSLSEEGLSVQYAFSHRISNNQSGDIHQPKLTDCGILRSIRIFNNDKFCHISLPKKAIYIYTYHMSSKIY